MDSGLEQQAVQDVLQGTDAGDSTDLPPVSGTIVPTNEEILHFCVWRISQIEDGKECPLISEMGEEECPLSRREARSSDRYVHHASGEVQSRPCARDTGWAGARSQIRPCLVSRREEKIAKRTTLSTCASRRTPAMPKKFVIAFFCCYRCSVVAAASRYSRESSLLTTCLSESTLSL